LPPVNILIWCIDVLASRYSWTRSDILEGLYWEELWEHTKIAANYSAEEKNAGMRFQFMIHADKKQARKWKDLPIPFPRKKGVPTKDISGVSQLPPYLQHVVHRSE